MSKSLPLLKLSPLPVTSAASGSYHLPDYLSMSLLVVSVPTRPAAWERRRLGALVPSAPQPGPLPPPAHATRSAAGLSAPLQGLLKKHEAFETDFTVHKDRVNDVCSNGQDLIKKVSLACWGDAPFPCPTPPCWGHRSPHKPSRLE